jgi:hypothetical protein
MGDPFELVDALGIEHELLPIGVGGYGFHSE